MRFRAPSLGFVYLGAVAVAFVAFFAWLYQPMWWEAGERRERELAEVDYLLRIAAKGSESRRAQWHRQALQLAAKNAAWERCALITGLLEDAGEALPSPLVQDVVGASVRVVGANAERWAPGARPMGLLVALDGSGARTIRLQFSVRRAGKVHVRQAGGPAETFEVEAKATTAVERRVSAGGVAWIELRADVGNFEFANTTSPGVRLVDVEVLP